MHLTPGMARSIARALRRHPSVFPGLVGSIRALLSSAFDDGHVPIQYRIDENDRIVQVNEIWDSFAVTNAAPELADRVVGTSLWGAIVGDEPRMLWRTLIQRVRAGASFDIPYRCDSPGTRRELRMRCSPLPRDGIAFSSIVEQSATRSPLELPHHDDGALIDACSWCNRIRVDAYVEIEEAVERLSLLARDGFRLTHTLCAECRDTLPPV